MVKKKKNMMRKICDRNSKTEIVIKLKNQRCDTNTFIICVDFFSFIYFHHCSKTIKARKLKFRENVYLTCNVSPVIGHESCVMCQFDLVFRQIWMK